jgi:hypothetical protein
VRFGYVAPACGLADDENKNLQISRSLVSFWNLNQAWRRPHIISKNKMSSLLSLSVYFLKRKIKIDLDLGLANRIALALLSYCQEAAQTKSTPSECCPRGVLAIVNIKTQFRCERDKVMLPLFPVQ